MISKRLSTVLFAVAASAAFGASIAGPGAQYATDAYPGFDSDARILATPKKEPGFFSWWSGPKKDNPADQLAWAQACEADRSYRAARKAYDALVAEWPQSPEAPKAQLALAELEFVKIQDAIRAFDEYKYLLDFYSTQCDYNTTVARLYEAAQQMRKDGKRICYFRFANTSDVRRAFEAVVRRAPGASFAPAAMMAVAELREDEGELEQAVEVYETLRNYYAGTSEAREALGREAAARMRVLKDNSYNRYRCRDTIAFLKMAQLSNPDPELKADLVRWQAEATAHLEQEAYQAARFYDSKTRTRRSAICAYERFLNEYPASSHAEEVLARLRELQQEEK